MEWLGSIPVPLIFLFGAVIGSFLNVVILRSIKGESLNGRSKCPGCQHTLAWYELVPVFSFLVQRGRCRSCGAGISLQYPIVELLSGIAAALLFPNILAFLLFAVLLVLFVTDLHTFLLPDFFTVLLTAIVLYSGSVSYGGMLIGTGFMLFLWAVTSGRGIGFGDVKLMIPLGLFFGVEGVVALLAGAFITGGLVGTYLLVTGKASRKTAIPFGPYLTGFAMLFLVYPAIIEMFWSFLALDAFLY